MLWLRKSKKGFTLIELMVVVAIIGILALLGLRVYTGQQRRAKDSIAIANAGTIQTLIQANLVDTTYATGAETTALNHAIGTTHTNTGNTANLRNPYDGAGAAVVARTNGVLFDTTPAGTMEAGEVAIFITATDKFQVRAVGLDSAGAKKWIGQELTAMK